MASATLALGKVVAAKSAAWSWLPFVSFEVNNPLLM